MSVGGPTRAEVPPDTRPGALFVGGLRRGFVLVFLPVFLAGQVLAWLTYAASGWYGPWSWFKIGLAETLASIRVPFVSLGPDPAERASLAIAFGALTLAVLVLAFRAGREQARGLERRPAAAALAGAAIAPGFALPMFVAAFPVTLGFPQFGIHRLEPVLWLAFVLPLAVGAVAGAVGGLVRARATFEGSAAWTALVAAAARGGAVAFWWAVVGSFLGFLVLAAVSPGPTGAYARFATRTQGSGAAAVIEHATLLPNQSVLFLTTAMGAPTTLSIGDEPALELTRSGIVPTSDAGKLLAALAGAQDGRAVFPSWFATFLVIPLAATVIGGRAAGAGEPARGARAIRGLAAGVVFALLCVVAAWAATLVVPAWAASIGGSVRIGPALGQVLTLALAWGVIGCALGASVLPPVSAPATAPR